VETWISKKAKREECGKSHRIRLARQLSTFPAIIITIILQYSFDCKNGKKFLYFLALKNCRENLVNLFCVVSDNPADCCRLCVACIATLTYTLNPKSPYFRDSLDELKYQSPVGHYRPILNDLESINFTLWCMSSATANLPGHRI